MEGSDRTDGAAQGTADHRYELIDRTGVRQAPTPYDTLVEQIRDGQLFRSDLIVKDDGPQLQLGEFPEFAVIFNEFMPLDALAGESAPLRSTPAFVGQIDPFAACGVFSRLWREQRTGRLFVRNGASEWMVAFKDGRPINATSNLTEEAIGTILRAQGLIDDAAFDQAVEFRKTGGGRIGSALVNLEKVSKRDLQRALSVQAMDRLMAVFRQHEGSFRFIADPKVAQDEMRLVATARDVIETGLAIAVDPKEVTAQLKNMGDPVLMVEASEILKEGLSEGDEALLELLGSGQRLSKVLPDIAHAAELTIAEARTRVLALIKYGVAGVADARYRELEATLQRLQSLNFFRALDVRRADTAEAIEVAFQSRLAEYGAVEADDDSEMVRGLRGQIRTALERARDTLLDEDERALYERAVQLGLDHEQPEVRKRLEYELLQAKGKAALARNDPAGAVEAFTRAMQIEPDQADLYIQLGWARFLAGEKSPEDVREAIRSVERSLELQGENADAFLYMGKIQRLAGLKQEAEAALRKALALNPNNHEATSELNLLFRRELDSGKAAMTVEISLGGLGKVAVLALLTFIGLYAAAMHVPGGIDVWPDTGLAMSAKNVNPNMRDTSALVQIRLNYTEEQLLSAAKALDANAPVNDKASALKHLAKYEIADILKVLSTARKVPPDQRVIGNQEYFFAVDDVFWWARRGALLLLGLIGFLLVRRDRKPFSVLGTSPAWILAGLIYGVVTGLLAPSWMVADPDPAILSGMGLFHTLAEQAFFMWFVGLALLRSFEEMPGAAVVLTGLLYGLYQLTYFAVLQGDVMTMVQDVGRVGFFGAGAWALLLLRSGGILAPLVAQLAMYGMMVYHATGGAG